MMTVNMGLRRLSLHWRVSGEWRVVLNPAFSFTTFTTPYEAHKRSRLSVTSGVEQLSLTVRAFRDFAPRRETHTDKNAKTHKNEKPQAKSAMGMDTWVVGQIAFWYTVYEVNPTTIVDKVVSFWVDLVTPGRGAGESSWFMKGWRSLEQSTERASREMDVRQELRRWDSSYPEIHHELIVRWVCGAAVSLIATSFYNSVVRSSRASQHRR